MTRRFRPRKEIKFWLYRDIALEARMIEYIEYLRHTRQFARTIRSGLRLMWTLSEGDTSVLFELFPTLRSQFAPDNTALIEEFRRMLHAQTPTPALPSGLKPIAAAQSLPMPTIDDDDTVVIRRDTDADNQSTANFLQSMSALQ